MEVLNLLSNNKCAKYKEYHLKAQFKPKHQVNLKRRDKVKHQGSFHKEHNPSRSAKFHLLDSPSNLPKCQFSHRKLGQGSREDQDNQGLSNRIKPELREVQQK